MIAALATDSIFLSGRLFIFSAFLAVFHFASMANAQADRLRIIAFGDSLVHGYGLAQGDGFVPQMQAWLSAHGSNVILVNAGVSGDTTAGGLARMPWTLGEKVDGMILALGGNDALRGLDPALARQNLDKMLSLADEKGIPVLLVGIMAPGNFGKVYKQAFEANYPALASAHGALLYPNFMAALARMPDRAETLQNYYQADRLHPNKAGVALIVKDMGPAVLSLVQRARHEE